MMHQQQCAYNFRSKVRRVYVQSLAQRLFSEVDSALHNNHLTTLLPQIHELMVSCPAFTFSPWNLSPLPLLSCLSELQGVAQGTKNCSVESSCPWIPHPVTACVVGNYMLWSHGCCSWLRLPLFLPYPPPPPPPTPLSHFRQGSAPLVVSGTNFCHSKAWQNTSSNMELCRAWWCGPDNLCD